MSAQTTGPANPQNSSMAKTIWRDFGMIVVLVVIFILCSLLVPRFLSVPNMKALTLAVSMTGMVACTMMFCLASGNFDMSCGAVVACSGVVAAQVINLAAPVFGGAVGMILGILASLGVGLLVGLVNGVTIAYIKINALITTLATMQIARGFGYIIGDGRAVGVSVEEFFALGTKSWLGIPIPVYITIVCFAVFGTLLEKTAFGRNTLAIGGNEEAANLAGIRVSAHKLLLFILHGLMAAFAGVVLASRMTSGQPTTSQGFELDVISACVLGGISMAGGIASIWFAISGVLIMGILQNSMNLMNVQTFYQYVARGLILLIAVIFDKYKQKYM
ncbi:MAG: L-arabinose ABC transporter permease AraH [Planctomycetota bacterium]|jgi:L-arabinose transport system permease protein|nr:L-arabinose ABC transporter permease AraH [Planctomycetota bacterium]